MSIPTEPQIPFDYRQVHGQSQKGDGIWDGRRFVKVKPVWPDIKVDDVVIRRCEVVQPELVSEVDTRVRHRNILRALELMIAGRPGGKYAPELRKIAAGLK